MINSKFEFFLLGSICILGQKSMQLQSVVSCNVIEAVIGKLRFPCLSEN